MNIGIDLDDTTFITVDSMIKYADIYDTKILGRKGTNGKLGRIKDRYYLKTLYGWDDETKFNFFNMFYKDILEECVAMENASQVINKLKEQGNRIFFITARLNSIPNCNTYEITKNSLEKNNINYDQIIVNASDKLKVCKDKDIQIFIEDSYSTCKKLEKNGVKTYLMTTKMNEKIDAKNIERVSSWDELYIKLFKF